MRKISLIILLILSQASIVEACDICGCGAGSAYLGILPEFNSRIIGLRYRYNAVQTHLGPEGTKTYLTTEERYRTAEIWAGWNFGKRWRLMAYVPLSFNSKTSEEEKASKVGLGDAGVQAMFHLLNRKGTFKERLLIQDLWIGAGIKLPTGKYAPANQESHQAAANLFQLGTGSFDFLATAMYDLRANDAGLNVSASYKMNTGNKYEYSYGNKWNMNAQLYYKFRIKKVLTVAPNAGIGYERSARDLDEGYQVFNSGGAALFGTLGAELNYQKIAAGGNWQPPLSQDLAAGIIQVRNKIMVHIALVF